VAVKAIPQFREILGTQYFFAFALFLVAFCQRGTMDNFVSSRKLRMSCCLFLPMGRKRYVAQFSGLFGDQTALFHNEVLKIKKNSFF
jgi:hypothetical protein